MATRSAAAKQRTQPTLSLAFDFEFSDLYRTESLAKLDTRFVEWLGAIEPQLSEQLLAARRAPDSLKRKDESELLLAVAPHLEDFLAQLFGVRSEVQALAARHHELAPLYSCKRLFVQRRAMTKIKADEAAAVDAPKVATQLAEAFGEPFSELAFARHVTAWLKDEAANEQQLQLALRYAAWAALTSAGKAQHRDGVLFKAPAKLDPLHLVPLEEESLVDGVTAYRLHHLRRRAGFALTDAGTDLVGALDEANYCIWCHEQGRDSCSSGLKEKTGAFKKSPFGVTLAGCPLEERISEFHKLKTEGLPVAALAMIMVENPLCAATGSATTA